MSQRLVAQTADLLKESEGFAASVKDRRLGLEIAVIQTLARRLLRISRKARSFERARSSEQGAGCRLCDAGRCRCQLAPVVARSCAGAQVPGAMTAQVQQPGDARPSAARAGGSSFYLAMRILGREKREAMFEIYSFCRDVDEISPMAMCRGDKIALLAAWRENIDALYAGQVPPGLEGLARPFRDTLPGEDDFLAVIDARGNGRARRHPRASLEEPSFIAIA